MSRHCRSHRCTVILISLGNRFRPGLSLWLVLERRWRYKRSHQDERGLQCRSRAERETLLAVPALLAGDLRDKADLPVRAPVHEADGVFLLDLGAEPYAQAAQDAERGIC